MNFGKLSAAAVERKLHCFLKKKEEKRKDSGGGMHEKVDGWRQLLIQSTAGKEFSVPA